MPYPDTPSPKPLNQPEFYALLALSRGDAHGYALKAIICNDSLGAVAIDDSRTYRVIAQLHEEGYIDLVGKRPSGKSGIHRMHYALTPSGLIRLKAECLRLNHTVKIAKHADLLNDQTPLDIQRLLLGL